MGSFLSVILNELQGFIIELYKLLNPVFPTLGDPNVIFDKLISL